MIKTLSLFILLGLTVGFCIWYHSTHGAGIIPDETNPGIKWNDSLYKHLPAGLDTNIIVIDAKGVPLKFHQYIKPVFNHEAIIFQDNGVWRLQRNTESGIDSLKKENPTLSRHERWEVIQRDTLKSWQKKLNNIAQTLAQADYVLVLKSQRQLLIIRKRIILKSLPISMGSVPVGKKQYENDGKTPEGIYNLNSKWVRNDKYYKSFVISYPNDKDKAFAKSKGLNPGKGVMIHGTKPGKLSGKDWTAGCIALANKDMDTLFKYVASGTVIEIRK